VRYQVVIAASSDTTINVRMRVTDSDSRAIFDGGGDPRVSARDGSVFFEQKIPSNARPGTYTETATVTYRGVVSTRSSTFQVQVGQAGLGLPFPAGTRAYIGPKEAHADNFGSILDQRTGAVLSFGNRGALASLDVVLDGDKIGTATVPATALDSGTVLAVWNTCQVLVIDHHGTWVAYLHLADIAVTSGQVIARGTSLGYPTTMIPPKSPCGNVTADVEHVHIAVTTGSGTSGNYQAILGKVLCGHPVTAQDGGIVLPGLTATRNEVFTVPPQC
jgi:hypothetical protein